MESERNSIRKLIEITILVCLGLLISLSLASFSARSATKSPVPNLSIVPYQLSQTRDRPSLLQQGLTFYRAEQFARAIAPWQRATKDFAGRGDLLGEALAWRYLSLSYQQLGQWQQAEEAIAKSLDLLGDNREKLTESPLYLEILGKALNTRGRLYWQQGRLERALAVWQQAASNYQQANRAEGAIETLINQAQVLQALGFSVRAGEILQTVAENLQQQSDSEFKAIGWRHLGQALRREGKLTESMQVLQASLAIASQPKTQSATLLELGNAASKLATRSLVIGEIAQAEQYSRDALSYYQQADRPGATTVQQVRAQLNQFSLLIEREQWLPANKLRSNIELLLAQLPPSRSGIYAQLNFAQSLMQLSVSSDIAISYTDIAKIIVRAGEQAQVIDDLRTQSFAWGQLGGLYELAQQRLKAQKLTEKALQKLEGLDAPDIRYRWEWQLGRLLDTAGDTKGAIAAYARAIDLLESVRSDLLLVDRSIQFSFRDNVEPIYRGLVDLLLRTEEDAEPTQSRLSQAIAKIDALQLAELENFLSCDLSPTATRESQNLALVDSQAAFIYPILLDERLEVIYRLPGQPLQHYARAVSRPTVQKTIQALRRNILRGNAGRAIAQATEVYQWLIEPLEGDLQASSTVKTLVFVLDSDLRNIPMGVLFDAQTNEYLVEKPYGLAVLPSSRLFDLSASTDKVRVLGAGIARPLQVGDRNFTALNVTEELTQIQNLASSKILIDTEFTRSNLQQSLNNENFSIVHLATHGNFSSNPQETYLLVSGREQNEGELLRAQDLDRLLRDRTNASSIDLLVLSACKTAEGDDRATLGLAGLAVRAGARSTLATLWQVSDASTVKLMEQFYRELNQPEITKAEALRRAQVKLLQDPQYQTPYSWGAYVLIGNWH